MVVSLIKNGMFFGVLVDRYSMFWFLFLCFVMKNMLYVVSKLIVDLMFVMVILGNFFWILFEFGNDFYV